MGSTSAGRVVNRVDLEQASRAMSDLGLNCLRGLSDWMLGVVSANQTGWTLNCSSLNYYLYHKNIIEDPRCTCGLPETNKHFLLECRKYNAIRMDMLHEVSQFCQPTLHTLLFGNIALTDEANESIFKYVHKFIQRSKRFEISSWTVHCPTNWHISILISI